MILLVPEINFLNFFLYFILSFICEIKAYNLQYFLYKFQGKIKLLDLSEYLDWEDCRIIKSNAVKIWEEILPRFPISKWQLKIRNLNLDLSLKAKQDLQIEIEKLFFLKHILPFNNKRKIYIIESLKFKFLAKIDHTNALFHYPTIKWLSKINILFDRLNLMLINLCLFTKLFCQFIYSTLSNKRIRKKIGYIYDGISPRELSIDKEKITFSWLIDDNVIQKKDILFLLPRADFQMKAYALDYTKDKNLLTSNYFNMLRLSSRKIIFSYSLDLLKIFINALRPNFNLEYLMLIGYSISILRWLPIVESLKPMVYICSDSNIGYENPIITYFNLVGIKTIIWTYGINGCYFLSRSRDCNFRNIILCNFISSTLVTWNQHFSEFVKEHPQSGLKIKVIGPLMSADERVLNYDKDFLFQNLGLLFDEKKHYISIFDSPRASYKYRGNYAWCPECYTEEYNYAFIRDMCRLLLDFDNIILIYKPKRSLTSGKFYYSPKLKKIFKDMARNPRIIILDYNINPWIAIAIADMCISIPFESPSIISLHYGKSALFHDPLNIASYHRYQIIAELITHSYEELKSKVKYWLFENNNISTLPYVSEFQGLYPGENSSNKFREYLKSLLN